jgi:uncharacterized repeat protein (TIGR01451 family)
MRICSRGIAVAALLVFFVAFSGCTGGGGTSIPFANKVDPDTAPTGSPALPVVISGKGFASSVLLVNGQPVVPTDVSPSEVAATIPASFFSEPGSLTVVVVNALPSGNVTSNSLTITVTGSGEAPVLAITKSHTANFTQGQTGATYTVSVSNIASAGSTSGPVTVTENPPTGLTVTNLDGGSAWTCVITTFSCTNDNVLGPGASYPNITVTVTVATNAPTSLTNQVTVTGGGSAPATASDKTTINSAGAPAFNIGVQTNSSTFPLGGTGAYTITITNSGTAATSGTITMTVTLSSGLTPGSLTDGSEWSCNTTMLTCTTTFSLLPGQSFNAITLDVIISPSAPASVLATFTVSGDGATAMTPVTTPTGGP